jgi:sugar-specific transcriptional regulator TrmB
MDRKAVNDESIETLMRLGLTFSQARIYLVLVESGESSVKTISQKSGVDRAEVYRKMPSLLKSGLAEKVLGIPIRFKAAPLPDGLNFLLKQENTEHIELQKKVTKLADNFKENNERTVQEIEHQFVVVPGKGAHIKWLKKNLEQTQITIESIVTWKDDKVVRSFCEKELQKATNRSVKSRTIIYISENEKTAYENDETFKNINSNSQKRIVFNPPLVLGGIFDSKEVVIATTLNNPVQTGETVFWSNNPSIIALFQNYFETLWKKALEHKNEDH